jgi:hypothetical protein
VCQHCGCHANTVIRRLSDEHDAIIEASGELRRAGGRGDLADVRRRAQHLAALLDPHAAAEESGLFRELGEHAEFADHLGSLSAEHVELERRLGQVLRGELPAVDGFVDLLRRHIAREEDGLFPAAVIALDGAAWERIAPEDGAPGE